MGPDAIDWTPTADHPEFEWDCSIRIDRDESTLTVEDGGRTCRFRGRPSFWKVLLRDRHGNAATIDGTDATITYERRRTESGRKQVDDRDQERIEFELTWRDEPVILGSRSGTATTTLRGRLEPTDPTLYWSIGIELNGVTATVQELTAPAFDDLEQPGDESDREALIVPDGWGVRIKNPRDRPDETARSVRYPDKHWAMQFLALVGASGAGYVGVHDPIGRPKQFRVEPERYDRTIGIEVAHEPDGVGNPIDRVELPYEIATGTVDGEWYDAARRYRRWATAEAEWTEAGPIADRDGVPEWLLEGRLWWLLAPRQNEPDRDLELLSALTSAVSVPTAVHWYSWHRGPFDVDYPAYFPSREGFEEAVAELESDDVRVVPYVNARIADPNSPTWNDRDLERAAARAASARVDPSDRPKQYEQYNDQQFVAMCPATEPWQRVIVDTVDRLTSETDVSGVYLDQLAAHAPPRCFASGHDHPAGGGSSGVEGYRTLLDRIRDRSSVAITSENNAEPYLDLLDGHLMWDATHAGLIPLYAAVYGEYSITFGRQYFEGDLDDPAAFRSKLAQSFAFGNQLGWIRDGVARRLLEEAHSTTLRYLERTASIVAQFPQITIGERLEEPTIDGVPTRELVWEPRGPRSAVELDEVLAGAWRSPNGSEIIVGLTNWSTNDRTVDVRARVPEVADTLRYSDGVHSGDVRCRYVGQLTPIEEASVTDNGLEMTVSLPGCETGAVLIDATMANRRDND